MVLLTEGEMPLSAFEHSTSAGKVFFEILDKLRKVETFGNFKQTLLLMECLIEVEEDKIAIVEKIQGGYFNTEALQLKGDPNFCSATFGSKQGDFTHNLHIGYFDTSIFSNTNDLFTFNRSKILENILKESKGVYLHYKRNEVNVSKIDLKTVRELTQAGHTHLKTLYEHGNF